MGSGGMLSIFGDGTSAGTPEGFGLTVTENTTNVSSETKESLNMLHRHIFSRENCKGCWVMMEIEWFTEYRESYPSALLGQNDT